METNVQNRLLLVTECCRDDAAVLALSVARTIVAGYMTGDVACWDLAHAGAESVMGAQEGGAFVAAIVGVVRALRSEGEAELTYLPATCCRANASERLLVETLESARGPTTALLPVLACRLAQAPHAPRLTAALVHAGVTMERTKGFIRRPVPAPRRPPGGCPVVH